MFSKVGKRGLNYILVTYNQFQTVLLESGECMVRQGRVFRGVFLIAGEKIARRLVRKRNLDEPYTHLSSNIVLNRLELLSNKNVH